MTRYCVLTKRQTGSIQKESIRIEWAKKNPALYGRAGQRDHGVSSNCRRSRRRFLSRIAGSCLIACTAVRLGVSAIFISHKVSASIRQRPSWDDLFPIVSMELDHRADVTRAPDGSRRPFEASGRLRGRLSLVARDDLLCGARGQIIMATLASERYGPFQSPLLWRLAERPKYQPSARFSTVQSASA
jgi:hypothetical protein